MKKTSNEIKVMIADDHGIVREGIKKVLERAEDIEIVAQAENGNEVLEKLRETDTDVLVMDIEMPGKSGWDILMDARNLYPGLRIIVLSIFPEEHYGPRFINAGASGYVSKNAAPANLVEAIRKVMQGGKFVSSKLADILISGMGSSKSEKALHETLSPREFQVFTLIARGKKLKEIADELNVSITTISTHRARILQKMDMKNTADLIHYAIKNDLVD